MSQPSALVDSHCTALLSQQSQVSSSAKVPTSQPRTANQPGKLIAITAVAISHALVGVNSSLPANHNRLTACASALASPLVTKQQAHGRGGEDTGEQQPRPNNQVKANTGVCVCMCMCQLHCHFAPAVHLLLPSCASRRTTILQSFQLCAPGPGSQISTLVPMSREPLRALTILYG